MANTHLRQKAHSILENLTLVNPYNEQEWKTQFPQTTFYSAVNDLLTVDGDCIIYNKDSYQYDTVPRQRWWNRCISAAMFYYMHPVMCREDDYQVDCVHDMGCGTNFMKLFSPVPVFGYDKHSWADSNEMWSPEFPNQHTEEFSAFVANGSLHFEQLYNFSGTVRNVVQCLKPGARAYLSLNSRMYTQYTDRDFMYSLDEDIEQVDYEFLQPASNDPDHDELLFTQSLVFRYIQEQILNYSGIRVLILDFINDPTVPNFSGSIDGNIRIVFQKL